MLVKRKHIDNTLLHRENTFVKQIFETMNQSFGGGNVGILIFSPSEIVCHWLNAYWCMSLLSNVSLLSNEYLLNEKLRTQVLMFGYS
ncbi:MAG: hypothetical protein CMB97_00420 [Flavobacteriaceae bacterium]|nr:hypothetical protein [Flavobacteriaceae bacterium]